MRTGKQGAADPAAAVSRQHRNPKLRVSISPREMGGTEQVQLLVQNRKYRVAPEIDARDIRAHRHIAEPYAKAQAPVVAA
jgi:hypothetical protein